MEYVLLESVDNYRLDVLSKIGCFSKVFVSEWSMKTETGITFVEYVSGIWT